MSHPQCQLVGRDQSTLSLCALEPECHLFPSSQQCKKSNCLPYHDVHVVPAQFPMLHKYLVDLLTNQCVNFEVTSIHVNKVMKH